MRRKTLGPLLLLASLAGCSDAGQDGDTRLALLAPYTGEHGATGVNVERSASIVETLVKDGGGLPSGSFGMPRRDTANDTPRALRLTSALLADPAVWGVVGPSDPGMGAELDVRTDAGAMLLLPGIAVKELEEKSSNRAVWLGPSANEMGCVLAQTAYDTGNRRIAVVHDSLAVSSAVAHEVEATLVRYFSTEKATVHLIPVTPGAGLSSVIAELRAYEPDSIVLSLGTKEAAEVIQDWSVLGSKVRWYLGSGLLNTDLVRNVPPGALEGAVAVAAAVPENPNSARFGAAYRARFGDDPFVSAYYYFDAAVVGVLAMAAAQQALGTGPETRAEVVRFVGEVASSPGRRVTWEELPTALQAIRDGEDIDYQGVTGSLTVTPEGKIIRTNNFDVFHVQNGEIKLLFHDACT
ncbi:MAG: ABC transporter substrate-binding protein [Polyangiaceae bacterium]|nr:ABC transporter substrate-binding protein [Polyangiaceae bacterium]